MVLNFKLGKKVTYVIIKEIISVHHTGRREIKQETSNNFNSMQSALIALNNLKKSERTNPYFFDAFIDEAW